MKEISLLLIGAGNRGAQYARHAVQASAGVSIAGVADPLAWCRSDAVAQHGIPPENVFDDWRLAAERERFADAVIIATQDAMHTEPAIAFLKKGYHVLLEKPMAPTEAECRQIAAAARSAGSMFAVCHVLRYTPASRCIRQIIDSGAIGAVVTIHRLEPVGYWHQAHSFVRGPWAREADSSFMLLAKSCHDLDWIRFVMGVPCRRVQSFGSLTHFRRDEKPAEAGDALRCLDCRYEPRCPYSARKIYLDKLGAAEQWWPVTLITKDLTPAGVTKALREGPYGRCVYECDNDVVDHQVVNMEFEGGRTATFTMTAFTTQRGRQSHICGTRGELVCDDLMIEHHDFLTDRTLRIDPGASDAAITGGHGGGDEGLVAAFLDAVRHNDPSRILTGPAETLESHLMAFAAERSRREGRVVDVA